MAAANLGGWSAEPVDFDPFAPVPDSFTRGNRNRDFGYTGNPATAELNPATAGLGFQSGGGVDDDPGTDVASVATGDRNAQPAAAGAGPLGRPGGAGGGEGLLAASGEASAPGGLSAEEAAEVARARAAAGRYQPVTGLPQKIIGLPDGSSYVPGPLEKAHQAAEAYMRESGLAYDPPREYGKLDKGFATRVAQAYEDMPHAPDDPAVRASYEALARETMAQWQHVKNTGLKVEWITPQTGDPYAANPRLAIKDVRDNNRWWGYPTDLGYGSTGEDVKAAENPMLADSGEEVGGHRARVNDIFRIVHDYFGHAKEGHGFRAEGEDNAFRAHSAMYSDAAKPAMTSELRGQNSWLNYGPHGEQNRTAKAADTIFADQKIGNMPEWTWRENVGRPMTAPPAAGRAPAGLVGEEEAAQRQREGFEPPGEWTGGRISMADGGALEPVDHDPFAAPPPDRTMQPTDLARAKGFPEPRSPMHDRIAAASRDEPRHGFAGGGGLESEEEELQRQREMGAATGSDLGSISPVRSPGLFGGARPVQPSAQFGTSAVTEPAIAPASAPAPSSIVRSDEGVLRHADPAFRDGRIATTTPWAADLPDPHQSGEGTIGHDTMQAAPAMYGKTAAIIKEMPYTGVKTKEPAQPGKKAKTTTAWTPTGDLNIPAGATPEEAHEAFIEHAKSNILALHDAVPEDIRQGSQQWYDGANAIAKQRAQQYDRPLENVAGVYAALSPQMDWYKNASLGDRVMDIAHSKGNAPFSPEMQDWAANYLKSSTAADISKSRAIFDRIKDTPLGQLADPYEQAHWIRAYDEAHNSRAYNLVNPNGTFGDTVKTKGGADAGAGWGTMDAIAKAATAFNARDMPTISNAMGDMHKVRNFYNNILNPHSPAGDVTIDTHAIAAGLLRPLSGADKDTGIGLGKPAPQSSATGAKGLYGAYAEAYRRAAAERGILPRQMQSITWEAIRGLYSPAEKRSAAFRRAVDEAWARHRTGEWGQQQVQQHLIYDPATGASRIRPPSWHTGAAIEEPD